MGKITLEPGESEKIISQPGADKAYNVNVEGAQVYLNHRANAITREGKVLKEGDRTVVSNLRGKPIYAKNPSTNQKTATVNVDRAGFSLTFQTRRTTETAKEEAGRTGKVDWAEMSLDVGSGSPTGRFMLYDNADGPDKVLEMVTFAFEEGSTVNESMTIYVFSQDADGNNKFKFVGNPENLPLNFETPVPVKEGWDVQVGFDNTSASTTKDVRLTAFVRGT